MVVVVQSNWLHKCRAGLLGLEFYSPATGAQMYCITVQHVFLVPMTLAVVSYHALYVVRAVLLGLGLEFYSPATGAPIKLQLQRMLLEFA